MAPAGSNRSERGKSSAVEDMEVGAEEEKLSDPDGGRLRGGTGEWPEFLEWAEWPTLADGADVISKRVDRSSAVR